MCLISKWRFPRKAKQDIVCYKELYYSKGLGILCTPYRNIEVKLGEIFEAEGYLLNFKFPYNKTEGYIHAYTTMHHSTPDFNFVVYKAIIPKGTRYHISTDGHEICARKMIITEEKVKLLNKLLTEKV